MLRPRPLKKDRGVKKGSKSLDLGWIYLQRLVAMSFRIPSKSRGLHAAPKLRGLHAASKLRGLVTLLVPKVIWVFIEGVDHFFPVSLGNGLQKFITEPLVLSGDSFDFIRIPIFEVSWNSQISPVQLFPHGIVHGFSHFSPVTLLQWCDQLISHPVVQFNERLYFFVYAILECFKL